MFIVTYYCQEHVGLDLLQYVIMWGFICLCLFVDRPGVSSGTKLLFQLEEDAIMRTEEEALRMLRESRLLGRSCPS
jgi:hypothetical protein